MHVIEGKHFTVRGLFRQEFDMKVLFKEVSGEKMYEDRLQIPETWVEILQPVTEK